MKYSAMHILVTSNSCINIQLYDQGLRHAFEIARGGGQYRPKNNFLEAGSRQGPKPAHLEITFLLGFCPLYFRNAKKEKKKWRKIIK